MVKIVYCLRRHPLLSPEEFQKYWAEKHGPLLRHFADKLGIRRVVQVLTMDDGLNQAMRAWIPGPPAFDGIVEFWVDSVDDLMSHVVSDEGRAAADALVEDTKYFVDLAASPIWVARDQVLFER